MNAVRRVFQIRCDWDPEAGVWYVCESDVPGLVAEASTIEEMNRLLQVRVPELLELNLPNLLAHGECEVPIELLTSRRSTVRIAC
jgi:predicted RNase H-like HicB family nuclease